jgi:uncharacterized repeat protein (TIGR01451 family)
MKKLLPIMLILFLAAQKIQGQAFEWAMVQDICPPNMQGESAYPPVIASDGTNLVSAGQIRNAITLGSQTFTAGSGNNSYLAKHDPAGNLIWALEMEGAFNSLSVTADENKNIYVAGNYQHSLSIGNFTFNNPNPDSRLFIAKFNAAGTLLWARQSGSGSNSGIIQLAADRKGKLYIASAYSGTFSMGNAAVNSNGQQDIFMACLDTGGNFQWLQHAGGNANDSDPSLSCGPANALYLAFTSQKNGGTPYGICLQKFDDAGVQQWSKFMVRNSDFDRAILAQDATENVYLAGMHDSTMTFDNLSLPRSGTTNLFLAKISPGGTWKWAKQIPASHLSDKFGMAGKGKNELVLFRHQRNSQAGNFETYIAKMDTAGAVTQTTPAIIVSTATYTDVFENTEVATDNKGNIYLAGGAGGNIQLNPINLNAPRAISSISWSIPSVGYIAKVSGNPNTATGTVFIDRNGNGLKEPGEPPFVNAMLQILPDRNYSYLTTDTIGAYRIQLPAGTYTLRVLQPASHYTFLPQNPNVSFAGLGQTQTTDIALVPIPGRNDVKVSVTNVTPARPGFTLKYRLTFENVGTTTLSDSLTFRYDYPVMNFTNATTIPATQQTGKMGWFYQNLQPTEKRNIDLEFKLDSTAKAGKYLRSFALVKPIATDFIPGNNADTLQQTVTSAFDPNDKQVSHATLTSTQVAAGKLLDYTIRFQNTGTDTAFTVIVRDSIGDNLQFASFEMLSASHPYTFRVLENNIVEWRFNNILLPDSRRNEPASHGFIRYRIKPGSSLVSGEEIRSRAAILFDHNAPVMTNYAVTKIYDPEGKGTAGFRKFRLYPNPAGRFVKIDAETENPVAGTLTMVNMLGQTVSNVRLAESSHLQYQLPLEVLPKGVYVIRLVAGKAAVSQRLLVQ